MTAREDSQVDPQQDAASLAGAPESAEESARARDLVELFGPLVEDDEPLGQVDDSVSREHLAALFAGQSATKVAATDAEPDFSWKPTPAVGAEPASAWAREPVIEPVAAGAPDSVLPTEAAGAPDYGVPTEAAAGAPDSVLPTEAAAGAPDSVLPTEAAAGAPDSVLPTEAAAGAPDSLLPREEPEAGARAPRDGDAETAVIAGGAVAASALPWVASRNDAPVEASELEASSEDSLAWLDRVSEKPIDTPEKAALGSWLGTLNGGAETTALPAAVAAAATTDETQVLPEAPAGSSSGSFFPAQRRGIRGWSSRVRWSVAVSIVLLIGVVVASVVIAQTISANNVAARELAAAVAELEAAEETATQPQSVLDAAIKKYDETVEIARATADSAGPPLAAIAGMAAQPLLDVSNAALAALVAQLDASTLDDPPEPYERGDVDVTDIEEVRAATTIADDHAELVTTATREVTTAQATLQEKLDALRAAQVVLGGSLPETAVVIVGENQDALQSFRDAVIAASVAVPAAQNAGGSGDAELLAYAAAVTALRGDQARAIAEEDVEVTPPRTTVPAPEPEPVPPPAPEPVPEPEPEPSQTTDPPPPPPTGEPVVP